MQRYMYEMNVKKTYAAKRQKQREEKEKQRRGGEGKRGRKYMVQTLIF